MTTVSTQSSSDLKPEPYAANRSVAFLDEVIEDFRTDYISTVEHVQTLTQTELQAAAGVLIPQAFSLVLSIRALIRDGLLFGAHMLLRPLIERACIVEYLLVQPTALEKWRSGWKHGDAPSLSQMYGALRDTKSISGLSTKAMLAPLHNLVHGKPESVAWNRSRTGSGGYLAGAITDRPDLCDEVCAETAATLAILVAHMRAYFPGSPTKFATPEFFAKVVSFLSLEIKRREATASAV